MEELIQYSLGSTLTKCSKTYTRIFMGHVFIKNAERNEKLCPHALLISLVVLKTRFLYLMRAHDKPRRTASSQTQVEVPPEFEKTQFSSHPIPLMAFEHLSLTMVI